MSAAELRTVSAGEERELIGEVLEGMGAPPAAAGAQAEMLVEADLRGRPSHGLQRLPTLVGRIENGLLDPAAEATREWVSDSALAVDGGAGFGPAVLGGAIEALAERAPSTGVAMAAVSNSSHAGMLALYVERAAELGLLAICLTTSEALVHPAGGVRAMIGTNPIAVGVPAEPGPFVLDMSTGAVSMGEIIAHSQRGAELPEGVAVDSAGAPTTDPDAALDGAISPFGGGKGFGIGLAIELLVATLTGSALGEDVKGTLDVEHPCNKGDVALIFDPEAFGHGSAVAAATAYLKQLRDSPAAPGGAGVRIPGDRARAEREAGTEAGIEVPAALWKEVTEIRERTQKAGAGG